MSCTHEQAFGRAATDADVLDLYRRCKALTLAVGATMLMDGDDPTLLQDALALAAEAEGSAGTSARQRAQIAGVRDAALAIAELIQDGEGSREEVVARAREAHRDLRRKLGPMIAGQYAPCGTHALREEVHSA